METLNLFYEEPDPDRWFPGDRYPRRLIRRLVRGAPRPGGQMRVFLNLCAGLDKIGVPYRVNDYRHARRHPNEVVCIIGKPHVLDKVEWRNPIIFGASVFSHPIDHADLLEKYPVKLVLVPGEWMRRMFEPYYGDKVIAWPVGIDTARWRPEGGGRRAEVGGQMSEISGQRPAGGGKKFDFLIYDKVRWEHERYEREVIEPIREQLRRRGLSFREIRYGFYEEEDYRQALQQCGAMIFLCEHETQGIAYQQALSCGVPILAWDRGGYWQDPSYFPERVRFAPVTSVPYWDDRCGVRFPGAPDFAERLTEFQRKLEAAQFAARDYVVSCLTLERCASDYLSLIRKVVM